MFTTQMMFINTLLAKVATFEQHLVYHHHHHQPKESMKLAAALQAIGDDFRDRSDLEQARLHYEKALCVYQQHQNTQKSIKVAHVSHSLARILISQGEWVEGSTLLQRTIDIYERKMRQSIDLAKAYALMGFALFVQSEYDEAYMYYRKAFHIFQHKTPDSSNIFHACYWFAEVLSLQNDMTMAQQLYEQALKMEQAINPESMKVADILAKLANILHDMGHTYQAHQYFEKALAIVTRAPGWSSGALVYSNLAEYMHKQGNTHHEQRFYQKAVAIDEQWNRINFQAVRDSVGLAQSLYENGDLANARLHYERVINMYEEGSLQDKRPHFAALELFFVANAYFGKGRVLDDEAEYTQSLPFYQKALDIYHELGSKQIEAFCSVNQRSWPTMNMVEQRIALHPTRLFTSAPAPLPVTWCHVFAKCGNDVQSIYYFLREQPHVVKAQ